MNKETKKDIEIRGFIYADGCFQIIRQKRKRYYKNKVYEFVNYIPRINITQRADNYKFLRQVKKEYGGWISENKSNKKSNPIFYWSIQSFEGCYKMLEFLINTEFDYIKVKSAKVLYNFCKWRLSLGQRKFTKKEMYRIEKWHNQIRKSNSYNGVT